MQGCHQKRSGLHGLAMEGGPQSQVSALFPPYRPRRTLKVGHPAPYSAITTCPNCLRDDDDQLWFLFSTLTSMTCPLWSLMSPFLLTSIAEVSSGDAAFRYEPDFVILLVLSSVSFGALGEGGPMISCALDLAFPKYW